MNLPQKKHFPIALFGAFALLAGCASPGPTVEQQQREALIAQQIRESKMNTCLAGYQVARQECESFLAHEKRLWVKDRQMAACLVAKAYPEGSATCSK
jgi:hypothetical protein